MKKPEQDLQIDEDQLDREWVRQPRLRYDYGVKLADAQREVDIAKVNLEGEKADMEKTAAKLHRLISASPDDYGLTKTTEAAIVGAVKQQPAYEGREAKIDEAKRTIIEASHLVHVLEAVVAAVDHRRRSLENLVSLLLADYRAKPRIPKGREEEVGDMVKRSVRQRQRRKRE